MRMPKMLTGLFAVLSGWAVLQNGCADLGGYGYGGYFPAYGLYDPTNDIQSVIAYRQSVMDWSASAWDEYIRE